MTTNIYELMIDYLDSWGYPNRLLMQSDSEEECKQVLAANLQRPEHIVTAFSITHRIEWMKPV